MEKKEIEKIIEQKIEERVENRVRKETKQLKQKITQLENKNQKTNSERKKNKKVSRREFLKKMGAGAVGLGALSLPGASALDIKDDNFSVITSPDDGSTLKQGLFVDANQNVSIPNGNMDLGENNLENVNKLNNLSMTSSVEVHSYQTEADVPNIPEGSIVYIQDQNQIFVEDGT